ncbi:MAG: hypothetical protein A2X55_08790 [Nitrospirae bacterium GWB2_47_37]|nr:MAG: hypothetical protein A2X55_08790 [Nitrospirae bacterium GWB2_47_37]HAK87607.1 hypothetical protein [Nitrospiraceae bacterium]
MKKKKNGNGKNDNLPVAAYTPVRVELNFFRHFIFTLDDKKESDPGNVITITRERAYADGRKVTAKLTVYVDYEYGRCGPFDYRAFRAVEKILTDIHSVNGELREGPIRLGREYSIFKFMGYSRHPSKDDYARLKIFFTRMQRMHFHSDFATFNPIKRRWSEGGEALDPLYKRVVFTYEKMPDDTIADSVYIWLGDFYRESLNRQYIAILDWNYYSSIKNLAARRIYEIISIFSHKHTTVYLWYSDICARMQLTREKYQSKAIYQLQRIYRELINKGFLKAVIWPSQDGKLQTKQTESGNDWIIKFETNKNYRAQLYEQSDLIQHQIQPQQSHPVEAPAQAGILENMLESQGAPNEEIVSDTERIAFPNKEDQRWYRFMKFYIQGCKKISKESYIFPKKDSKEYWKIVELFGLYPETYIKKLMDKFFTTTDSYISKQSYSVSFFLAPTTINKLISELAIDDEKRKAEEDYQRRVAAAEKQILKTLGLPVEQLQK